MSAVSNGAAAVPGRNAKTDRTVKTKASFQGVECRGGAEQWYGKLAPRSQLAFEPSFVVSSRTVDAGHESCVAVSAGASAVAVLRSVVLLSSTIGVDIALGIKIRSDSTVSTRLISHGVGRRSAAVLSCGRRTPGQQRGFSSSMAVGSAVLVVLTP